jgi:pimeloyl-ACP methyl ester carboxylesterase
MCVFEQKTIKITTYADDVRELIQAKFGSMEPVVIGHSFGGSVLMKMLEKDAAGVKGAGAWAGRVRYVCGCLCVSMDRIVSIVSRWPAHGPR